MARRSQCSNCCADLSGSTQAIGVEIPAVGEGILFWACPFCGFAWTRAFASLCRTTQAELHVWKWNRQNHVDVERAHAFAIDHGLFV